MNFKKKIEKARQELLSPEAARGWCVRGLLTNSTFSHDCDEAQRRCRDAADIPLQAHPGT